MIPERLQQRHKELRARFEEILRLPSGYDRERELTVLCDAVDDLVREAERLHLEAFRPTGVPN